MDFDDLQKAWQSQKFVNPVIIETDLLLKVVRRNQHQFWTTILWRDVREVGVAYLLVLFFFYQGWRYHDWTGYLNALSCFGVGMFMLVDRVLQWKNRPLASNSLKGCVESSLVQVNHQIWLLRNVIWWYLMPLTVAGTISMIFSKSHQHHSGVGAMSGLIVSGLIFASVFWWVYWLNQRAVRKSLEPRRAELNALLKNLR